MRELLTRFLIIIIFVNIYCNKVIAQNIKKDMIKWKIAGALPDLVTGEKQLGVAGPITGFCNKTLVIAGGANFPDGMPWTGAKKMYRNDIYLFQPEKDGTLKYIPFPQKLPQTLAYSANVNFEDQILIFGGENENGISDKFYSLSLNKHNNIIIVKELGLLPQPLTNLSATIINHTVYIAGGDSKNGSSNKFFSLDLKIIDATWKELPDIPVNISYTFMVSLLRKDNSFIYLIGGRSKNVNGISTLYNSMYRFDINAAEWIVLKPLPYQVSAATGIIDGSGEIIVIGGDRGEVFTKIEIFNTRISNEQNELKREILITEKVELLKSHPGFSKNLLTYNCQTGDWTSIGEIPFAPPATTSALIFDNKIFLPSGEIKAGVRTPYILSGEILRNHK